MSLMVKLKSGNLIALDAVCAVVRLNENLYVRLISGGEPIVIEPEDLNLFESEPMHPSKPK